jgi:hypothetical protein
MFNALLVFVAALVVALPCPSLSQGHGLTSEQVRALESAQGPYEVSILTGEVDGISRTVVILGETHLKTEKEFEQGRDVLAVFPDRSVEGIFLEGVDSAVYDTTMYVYSFKYGDFPSTIGLAQVEDHIVREAETVVREKQLTEGSPTDLSQTVKVVQAGGYDFSFRGSDMLNLHRNRQAVRVRYLEEGYRISFVERGALYGRPIASVGIFGLVTTTSIEKFLERQLKVPRTNGVSSHTLSRRRFLHFLARRASCSAILLSVGGALYHYGGMSEILDGRNANMVRNLLGFFRDENGLILQLAIVGRAHVPGMAQLLEARGFTSRPLR